MNNSQVDKNAKEKHQAETVLPMAILKCLLSILMLASSFGVLRSLLAVQESPSSCARTFYQHRHFYSKFC